jgi:tellurite resistance protein TehA-like permease
MQLGKIAMDISPKTHTIHELAGVILYNLGVFIALIFWSFALLWLFFAVATIFNARRIPFKYGMVGVCPVSMGARALLTVKIHFPAGHLCRLQQQAGIRAPFEVIGIIGRWTC